MSEIVIRHTHVVLDACCIINIAATGEIESILEAISSQTVVVSYVLKQEVLSSIKHNEKETPIVLSELVLKGLLMEVDIDYSAEDEPNYVVAFEAQNLDPGEADSAAIAINRSWAIATDDRRAINVVKEVSPITQILTTPELLKCWVDVVKISENRIKQAITSIRKYTPPKGHPLATWWQQYL